MDISPEEQRAYEALIVCHRLRIATEALRELLAAIDDPEMQEIGPALKRARRALEIVS